MATCPPKFANISKVSVHHTVTNSGQCNMIRIIKFHVIQAIALCSGNHRRHIGKTPTSAPPQPATPGACSSDVWARLHHLALPAPAHVWSPRRGCEALWRSVQHTPKGARGSGVTETDSRPARPTDAASRSRASGPPCSDPAPDTALSSANAALTCKIFEFFDDSFPMKLTDFGGGSNRKTILI